jgi:mRNA interferase MazF
MKVSRGDVVLVDFPYSDRTGSKVRPALVVQADSWNQALDDTILALITSSGRRRVSAVTQLVIQASSPEGRAAGLRIDSLIQCENLLTYDQSLILRHMGSLPDSVMQQVDACLKETLDIL